MATATTSCAFREIPYRTPARARCENRHRPIAGSRNRRRATEKRFAQSQTNLLSEQVQLV